MAQSPSAMVLTVLLSALLVLVSSLAADAQSIPFPGIPRCTLISNLKPNKVLSSNLGGDSGAYGYFRILVFQQGSKINIKLHFDIESLTAPLPPTGQALFDGRRGSSGALVWRLPNPWTLDDINELKVDSWITDADNKYISLGVVDNNGGGGGSTASNSGVTPPDSAFTRAPSDGKANVIKPANTSSATGASSGGGFSMTKSIKPLDSDTSIYDLIKKIDANPGRYYVQINTQAFPNGAIRGQIFRRWIPQAIC
ncbi:unnamed protein product [Closterium sp. Naga37s-1]|nr:unnamed protein product [Closterium sp. Naga37s-1]